MGTATIAELVDEVNQDLRRGVDHEKVLTRIEIDYQAKRLLEAADYAEETVLEAGEVFYLRSTGNLSTGGTAIDMTDLVTGQPEMAQRAARYRTRRCGCRLHPPDITRSYREIGGAICEVNAAPGFRMCVAPTEGTPRCGGTRHGHALPQRHPHPHPDRSAHGPMANHHGACWRTS